MHAPLRRNPLFGVTIFDDLDSPRFRDRSPIRDWPARRACVISSNVSVVRASYKVSRGRSMRWGGEVRKRGDVYRLPKAEAIIWYLDFVVSEPHP